MENPDSEQKFCSFCAKSSAEVDNLIAGESANICSECLDVANDFVAEYRKKHAQKQDGTDITEVTPSKIKEYLDQYIVGQDDAKITMAVAVYNHYKRINNPKVGEVEIKKSNMLLLGPTGSGKTLMAETVAKFLGVPFVIADCTTLTEAGYIGEDVDTILTRLLAACNGDVARASRGIVFLDEVDKIRVRHSASGGRDVSGEGVQQGLLKMLEGTEVMVTPPGAKRGGGDQVRMDTRNILFVVSGAFVGLDKIVAEDLKKGKAKIGFGGASNKTEALSHTDLQPEHLVKFGLIPEFVGRLPVAAVLKELNEDQLVHVLTQPKNALVRQYQALFSLDNVELDISDEALRSIAKIAIARKTGARGLHSVLESKLTKLQFELPDLYKSGATKIVLGPKVFDGGEQPVVLFENGSA